MILCYFRHLQRVTIQKKKQLSVSVLKLFKLSEFKKKRNKFTEQHRICRESRGSFFAPGTGAPPAGLPAIQKPGKLNCLPGPLIFLSTFFVLKF